MAEKAQTSASKRKIRQWSHEVLNNVAEKPDDERLEAAEEALDKAPDDDARQTLIELSIASPDDITAAFVRAAVRKGSMQLARAAADLLMDVTEADSAQSIIQECLVADDRSVRRRAVEAIETLEGPAALELLTEAFNSDDNGVRRAAVNTFGLIVGSKYHALKNNLMELLQDRESELYKSIVESEDMNLRREIAQVLGYADRPDVVTILEDLSKDPDTQTRRETVLALAALRNERAVEILRDKLDDPDEVLVSSVLDCLAAQQGRESAEMLDALRKGLKHPDPDVRRHAVLMLNQFELSEVEELLKETTGDSDYEVERSAKELLRMLESEAGAPTLEESEKDQSAEEQTLSIWEAGNIGMESESAAESSAIKSRSSADAGDVLPILERTAIEGSSSQRVHAITELLELEDIAESYALQRALYDSEDVVRSRASAALDNTRDAGLLVDVLQRHPDALTRRRAVEALRDNPGGRQETWGRLSVSFTSERSEGMEVFSYLLEALQDHDEGVRQIVLRAIEEFVEFNCPFPVPQTIEALQRLTEDESLSALFRENVGQLIEDIEEANFGEPLIKTMDRVIEWRGKLARHAHALRRNDQGELIFQDTAGLDADQLEKLWRDDLELSNEEIEKATEALESGEALQQETAEALMQGIVRCLAGALDAFYHAAKGLAKLGETDWASNLEEWQKATGGGPSLEWGGGDLVQQWQELLPRLRKRARIGIMESLAELKGDSDPAIFDEACQAEDDWVKIAALTARSREEDDPQSSFNELETLVEAHRDETDFVDIVAPAAAALLIGGRQKYASDVAELISQAPTDLGCEITQQLMTAAQEKEIGEMLADSLAGESLDNLGNICLAMAIRGGTGKLAGHILPDDPQETHDIELVCGHRALGAMLERSEDADALKELLRYGEKRERYCAASYLGIARVRSALSIFASVSDQVESDWDLRSLAGGILVRRGQRQGMKWFVKNAEQGSGRESARTAVAFGRALEDIIPIMLHCQDVNLGRFV